MVKLNGFKKFNRRVTGVPFEESEGKYFLDYTPLFDPNSPCPFNERIVKDFLEGEVASGVLMDAFLWQSSPEGHYYWSVISHDDKYIEDLEDSPEVSEKLEKMVAQYYKWLNTQ